MHRRAGTTATPLLMDHRVAQAAVAEAVHQAVRHHLTAAPLRTVAHHPHTAAVVHRVVIE